MINRVKINLLASSTADHHFHFFLTVSGSSKYFSHLNYKNFNDTNMSSIHNYINLTLIKWRFIELKGQKKDGHYQTLQWTAEQVVCAIH